jgi:hypothetical protein
MSTSKKGGNSKKKKRYVKQEPLGPAGQLEVTERKPLEDHEIARMSPYPVFDIGLCHLTLCCGL